MKAKIYLLLILTLPLMVIENVYAQPQQSIIITANVNQPVSPFIAQLSEATKLMVQVSNNGQTTASIKLAAHLERISPSPLTITLSPSYQPVQPIILAPGQMMLLTSSMVEQTFGNFRESNLLLSGISINDLKVGGMYKIPEGQYRLCFTAYDYNTPGYSVPVSIPGTGCTIFNMCYRLSAPQLVMPVNALAVSPTSITRIEPSSMVTFSWTPPTATCGSVMATVNYELQLFALLPGQLPTDAVRNPPLYHQVNLLSTGFPFQTTLNQHVLDTGKNYVVRIKANQSIMTSGIEIENDGFSQPVAFQYGSVVTAPPPSPTTPVTTLPVNNCQSLPVVSNTTALSSSVDLLNQEVLVGGFRMKITQVTSAGGTYSGKGHIYWKPLLKTIQLAVNFTGLKINTDKVVYDGTVLTSTTPQAATWETLQVVDNATGMIKAVSEKTAKDITQFLNSNSATRFVSKMTGDMPVDFPIGLDKEIEGTPITLALMGISFTPRGSSMTVLYNMEIPDANGWLSLAGTNFCIKPDGFSFTKGSLYLPEDKVVNLGGGSNATSFKFKASPRGPADSSNGTYINWNSDGIEFLLANAEMDLPRSAIIPEGMDGNPITGGVVTAKLKFNFIKWQDWIASVQIPKFQFTDISGFSVEATTVYYDHSSKRNAPGIVFPDMFAGVTGTTFEGLWIKEMTISLPPDFKTFNTSGARSSFKAHNMVVDNNGVSASLTGNNVINLSTGNLGGWSFSLDKINILFVSNTYTQGSIEGQFRLPVSNDPLLYTGILLNSTDGTSSDKGLHYVFNIKPPSGNYNVNLWKATMTIESTSAITIMKDQYGAGVRSQLNGFFSVNAQKSSSNPTILLPELKFERMILSNRDTTVSGGSPVVQDKFRFSHGTWKFGSPQKSAGGFPLTLDKLKPVLTNEGSDAIVGFGFDALVTLGLGDKSVVSGSSTVNVLGKIAFSTTKAPVASFHKVSIEKIEIAGKIGPVEAIGSVEFFASNVKYGDGVKGKIAAIFPMVRLDATVQFGIMNSGNTSEYNYWYIDACAAFKPSIPVFTGFNLAGFGGGAYYNMTITNSLPAPENIASTASANASKLNSTVAGATVSGVDFLPKQNSAGMRASLIFSLSEENAFNAKLTLTAQMQNGGLSKIALDGQGFALTNYPSNSNARVKGNIYVEYNFPEKEFIMTGDLQGNLGATFYVPLSIYASANQGWYFKLGEASPINKRASITMIDAGAPGSNNRAYLGATAYFNAGSGPKFTIMLPDLPPEVQAHFPAAGRSSEVASLIDQFNSNPGSGFMFGAQVKGDFSGSFLIFYASLNLTVGLDMALKKFTDFKCNGVDAGYEGWYGMGQLYAMLSGEAGVSVDVWFFTGRVHLCKITAATVLRGGFPNPTWAEGAVLLQGSVLGGYLKFNSNFNVTVGKKCLPPLQDPLRDIQMISAVGPVSSAGIYDIPYAQGNIVFNEDYTFDLPPSASNEHGERRSYRFLVESFQATKYNKTTKVFEPVDGTHLAYDATRTHVTLESKAAFDPFSTYEFKVVAIAKQYDFATGTWHDPLDDKAGPGKRKRVEEVHTFRFNTKAGPGYIPADQVDYSYPIDKQRYVLKEQINGGWIQVKKWDHTLFSNKSYFAYFINKQMDTIRVPYTVNPGTNRINFPLVPALKNKSIYRVEFWTEEVSSPTSPGGFRQLPNITNNTQTNTATGMTTTSRMVSSAAMMAKKAPVFILFFGTSEYNNLSQKLSALGAISTRKTSNSIELTTLGGEKFELYDVNGFKNATGKLFTPLVSQFVRWDDTKARDQFMSQNVYGNIFKLASMGISVQLGSYEKRVFNMPILTLKNTSKYSTALEKYELPWPPRMASGNTESSLFRYTQTSFNGPLFNTALLGGSTMGVNNFALLNHTSKFNWEREAILYQDFLLVQKAANKVLQLINVNRTYFNNPNFLAAMQFANPVYTLSVSSTGGITSASLKNIYYIYKDAAAMTLLQRISSAVYKPDTGGGRTIVFRYTVPGATGSDTNKTFTY